MLPGLDPLGLAGPSARPSTRVPAEGDAGRFWQANPFSDLLTIGRPEAGVPAPLWSIQPSIEVQGIATDNVRNAPRNREADYFTRILPRLTLSADTAELVGAVTYQPTLELYPQNPDQNRLTQGFGGQATATVIEDFFFVDVRGAGDARSVFGDFGPNGTGSTDLQNRVRQTTYQISPFLVQRFGGLAVARVGYAYRDSVASGRDTFAPGQTQPFFTQQNTRAQDYFAALSSGEDWGRLAWQAQTVTTDFDGSGVFDGARRQIHTLQARYALTEQFALLGEGGWQDERYSGVRPLVIQAPIWSVGVRYTPDEESFLSVRYGQRNDAQSWAVDGAIPVGVRTRLFASYNESLGNPSLVSSSLLGDQRVGASGALVSGATGVPTSITGGSPLLATQNNLFRIRRGTVALSQVWPLDVYTIGLTQEDRTPVAVAAGTTAFAQDSTSIFVSWVRPLAPGTILATSAQYGITESSPGGRGTSYAAQATLAQAFSDTLFGTLQYRFSHREIGLQSGTATQNTAIVSLRQLF